VASDPLVSLLADLVAIPSMNPMGSGRTGPEYSEARIADYVAAYLRRNMIDVETYEVAAGRPNVLGYVSAGADSTLLLEAHTDTVHVDSMTIPPFDPVIRDGRLFGRGSCDTKGSLAAFLHSVSAIVAGKGSPKFNVIIAAIADEEYRFSGARSAVERGLKADLGISGEPTRLAVVRAHKGVTRWKITTHGVPAHSAYPEQGENAIYRMGAVLRRLEAYAKNLRESRSDPLLGPASLSVGVISGGEAVNVVPDRCVIEIDRRTLPGESREEILSAVHEALRGESDWEGESPYLSVEGMDVAAGSAVVNLLSGAVREVTGSVNVEAAQYATDAGIYNTAGIPTVVFGPGDINDAHTRRESIELESLMTTSHIIRRLLC
jgi:acetylornithine deacetylase